MTALAQTATRREIPVQPASQQGWAGAFDAAAVRGWGAGPGVDEVWFCGAGSSACSGDNNVGTRKGHPGPAPRAVPTNDLPARPPARRTGRRPLMVNVGRSGNSAKTIGILDGLAREWRQQCPATTTTTTTPTGAGGAIDLPVDDPVAGLGTLSRVVSGVPLYPVTP